jgi:hypothetical protein
MGHDHVSCRGGFGQVKIIDRPQELTDGLQIRRFKSNWVQRIGASASEEQGEHYGASAATFWSPELASVSSTAAVHGGLWC